MLSNPPAIFLLRSLPSSRPLVRACRNSRSSTLCFFRIPFIFLPRRTTSITSILPDRPPPPQRCFIFTVPTNGRGPQPIADGNALEEIHVACKKNYDSSAFPPNGRLLNERKRDAGKYRGFYMVSLGFEKRKEKEKNQINSCNLV